jgi:hypothetical protein
MINLFPLTPPDYHKNLERAGDLPTCAICGRGIKAKNPQSVHVHAGGAAIVTEEEAAILSAAADMGWFPIGPECLRKHPEIKPYAWR